MKKIVYLMIIGCLVISAGLFSFAPSTSAAAPVTYTLYIDGKILSSKYPTVVEGNTTLIPMKAVLTELNYNTAVDNKTKAITAKNSTGSFISVKAGSKKAKINGSETLLPASVKAMNGTTYIPISAVKLLTGKSIGVDKASGIAWIGDKPTDPAVLPTWGVTPNQVKAVSGQKLLIDEGGQGDIYILTFHDQPEDPEELYIFYKNKLAKIGFLPVISGYNEAELLSIYDAMVVSLINSYGEPEVDTITVDEDSLERVTLDNGGYLISKWNVGNTIITLLLKATDTDYTLNLTYVNASVQAQLDAAVNAIK
ncbi:copper amine oxidase N-terminal domain-containing protein [Paenibacillus segetis]|uniref:Copper amine oxidase-like N-terminal domain-containing protein n=1 Tax=Paenibacillus segetis TaxID=1325360 RepID=A0ABQ1YN95_9BACL|nr:copper amine oxidase N-terminal domain-containing protein [Paenibacillus segetis]GGH30411.1 hypothetical protein GCM10008013_33500 [Paenibacillus segetis]